MPLQPQVSVTTAAVCTAHLLGCLEQTAQPGAYRHDRAVFVPL